MDAVDIDIHLLGENFVEKFFNNGVAEADFGGGGGEIEADAGAAAGIGDAGQRFIVG